MSEHARHDAPRYRLHVEYTFDDYNEAVRCDASVVAGGWRWRGLLAWGVLFALVIFPQLWLRPVPGSAGTGAPPLGRALINFVAALLPVLIWPLLFAFILTNVYLTVRGRKRHRRPAFQSVRPGAEASFGGRLGWVLLVAVVLVAQTLVSAASSRGDEDRAGRSVAAEVAVRLVPTMVFLAIGGVILWYGMRARIRRVWHGQPSLHLRNTYEFFDDRVIVDTTQSRTETKWTAFPHILETPNLLLLYVSDLAFHILPKRTVAGEGECERFRAFLVEHVATPTQAFPVVTQATQA